MAEDDKKKISELFDHMLKPEDFVGARWKNPKWVAHLAIQDAMGSGDATPQMEILEVLPETVAAIQKAKTGGTEPT